jgi:hypothetical protein
VDQRYLVCSSARTSPDLDFSNVLRFPLVRYAGIVVLRVPQPLEPNTLRERVFLKASEQEEPSRRLWIVE